MSKIVAIMSISLDGYVADLDNGVAEMFGSLTTSLVRPPCWATQLVAGVGVTHLR